MVLSKVREVQSTKGWLVLLRTVQLHLLADREQSQNSVLPWSPGDSGLILLMISFLEMALSSYLRDASELQDRHIYNCKPLLVNI